MKKLFFLLVLLVSPQLFSQNLKQTHSYSTIDVDSALSLIQANYLNPNFIILDLRTSGEYSSGHLVNGVNFDYYMTDFASYIDTLIKEKTYLIHCASGSRSGNAFNTMQTMGFSNVFNMSGGYNAWNGAGHPTTTAVAPYLLPVSDTLVSFVNVTSPQSLEITITNYGNDVLQFNSITNLSLTNFSTNFNLNTKLTGLMDYTFTVNYSPLDNSNDSVAFIIESNGGDIELLLKGNSLDISPTEINNISANDLQIYPNPGNGIFNVEYNNIMELSVVNANGQTLFRSENESPNQVIDLSGHAKGIYFIRINTGTDVLVKKIVLN